MYEDILLPKAILDNWQMSPAERMALTGILARIKPKGALEVGVYFGGSLSLTSQFAQHIIGIDIDSRVKGRFDCPPNAEIWICDSEVGIPSAFAHFDRAGIAVNFVLVDADHSSAGIARDLRLILQYIPREPLVVLTHDSGNPECRQGILSVDWASSPHCHEVEVDFVPGQIPEHSVKSGSGEIWGGFALAYFDPKPRNGPPIIRQSAATSLRCLRFLVNNLPPVGAISEADEEIRLERGVTLRPSFGLESVLLDGWSSAGAMGGMEHWKQGGDAGCLFSGDPFPCDHSPGRGGFCPAGNDPVGNRPHRQPHRQNTSSRSWVSFKCGADRNL